MDQYNFLVGKSVNEVKGYAESAGLIARIVNVDNIPMVLTCDYNTSRLNLTVENGIVTEILVGWKWDILFQIFI